MKLPLLIASLATVFGALADEAVIYESPNYRGRSHTYVSILPNCLSPSLHDGRPYEDLRANIAIRSQNQE